ncbi:MAG: recombination protein O N-terminal domain-containing protein, partial [Planctomycetota bacterium]
MGVSTTGLTLQRVPFSETSQVTTFLTHDLGRVVSMVKGAFRTKNNFQGNMDLMELSRLTFSKPKGGSMLLLRHRVLLNRYPRT